MYTNIDGKWIENGKIFPEDGASHYHFGSIVVLLVSSALFGAYGSVFLNFVSAYAVDLCVR